MLLLRIVNAPKASLADNPKVGVGLARIGPAATAFEDLVTLIAPRHQVARLSVPRIEIRLYPSDVSGRLSTSEMLAGDCGHVRAMNAALNTLLLHDALPSG